MKHLKLFEGFHVSDYYHKANLSDTNNQFFKLREHEIDIEQKYIDKVKSWSYLKDVGEIL